MAETQQNPPKSWLAKAVTVLATIFGISLGLCGVNVFAFMSGLQNGSVGSFLIVAAYLEVAGMILSAVGLVLIAVRMMAKAALDYFNRDTEDR